MTAHFAIDQPERLAACEAADAIAAGHLTVEALARALLKRISDRPEVKAWAYLDEDLILAETKRLDAIPMEKRNSPLFGVPVAIKDIIYTSDMPTGHGCERYQGNRVALDATAVTLLREAGCCLIFGKTMTHEFAVGAVGDYPPTRDPHDIRRSPGGSSSGSAAAVADFQVPLALGTQTGGSTICPASYNGIIGFKPTKDLVSLSGVFSVSPTYDTIGLFARSVEDVQRLASVLLISTSTTLPRHIHTSPIRIACCRMPYWEYVQEETREAYDRAVELLRRDSRFLVESVTLPALFHDYMTIYFQLLWKEFSITFAGEMAKGLVGVDPSKRKYFKDGKTTSWQEYQESVDAFARMRLVFDKEIMQDGKFEALFTLSVTQPAPIDSRAVGDPLLPCLWSALHVPSINLPGFCIESNGMPLGMSLVGVEHDDARLLKVAARISEVFDQNGEWKTKL